MLKRCRPLLGTFVEVSADDGQAIDAAFAAVERVHQLMSAHEFDSDVSRINRFAHIAPVEVHDWTALVIERALCWSKRSDGAFDVVRAGKTAVERGLIPRYPNQPQPKAFHWRCAQVHGGSVRLVEPGCIDLGGIAKGFAVDRAVEALRTAGAERGLVNAGGDLRGFGPETWPVTLVDPLSRRACAEIAVRDEALATTAGLVAGNGLSFEHLGGDSQWTSVSVIASNACDADALTKILWSGTDAAVSLIEAVGAKAIGLNRQGDMHMLGMAKAIAA